MSHPSQANVADNCVTPVQTTPRQMASAGRQPTWLGVLAAIALFAIGCVVPLLFFPRLHVTALACLPVLLFAVVYSFAAYRLAKTQQAFDERLSALRERRRKAERRALKAEKHALLYDEFVALGREWEATFEALPDGVFLFDAEGRLSRINRAGALLENSHSESLEGIRCCDMFWRVEGAAECA